MRNTVRNTLPARLGSRPRQDQNCRCVYLNPYILPMYSPYANTGYAPQGGLQHPQPQHVPLFLGPQDQFQQNQQQNQQQFQQPHQQQQQHFNQQQQHQGYSAPYSNLFNDPAAAMAALFAKNSFGSSNQYLQQNLDQLIGNTGNINYYFKVSNLYVLHKLGLILFPYRNKNWVRLSSAEAGNNTDAGSTPSNVTFATPAADVNAPDLYIPLMAFITYILLWAAFQGLKGDFHPQLFGVLASQTLACSVVDILIFKAGLYLLNCSTQSSLWDLISFSGYKYVTIVVLLCWKHLVGGGWLVYYTVVVVLTTSLLVFLMRSLKFLVLPNATSVSSTASNSISNRQRKIRVQFLFVYAVVVQFVIALFMSR